MLNDADLCDDNIEMQMMNEQTLCDVRRLVDTLPDNQREVVYMRYYQDLSFKEIAENIAFSLTSDEILAGHIIIINERCIHDVS